jgi:hypothetical protein
MAAHAPLWGRLFSWAILQVLREERLQALEWFVSMACQGREMCAELSFPHGVELPGGLRHWGIT